MELEDELFNDGLPKAYYKQNDKGQYVLETNAPWAEKVSVALLISVIAPISRKSEKQ